MHKSNRAVGNAFEQETWLPISNYETQYLISDKGNVFSLKRNKLLKMRTSPKGYGQVNLSKNGKLHTFRVHRLVATHFIPNPYDLPEVNHKNENKLDNRATNLEWCDRVYNVTFGDRTNKQKAKLSKPVSQISLITNEIIRTFPSTVQAQLHTGVFATSISACCLGKRKSAGGFKWMYEGSCEDEQ